MSYSFIRFKALVIILFIGFGSNYANTMDSLKQILKESPSLIDKASIYQQISELSENIDTTILYGEQSLTYYIQAKNSEPEINSLHYSLGIAYIDTDLKKSKHHMQEALSAANKNGNDSIKAINYLSISAYYSRDTNIDSSIFYITKATEYFNKIEDSVALTYCYYTLMSNYNDLKKSDRSIYYGEKALYFAQKKGLKDIESHITVALAFTYIKSDKNEILATEYIKKAKKIAKKSNNIHLLSEIVLTTASKNFMEKKFELAMQDYTKVIKFAMETNDKLHKSTAHYYQARCLFELGNTNASKINFLKSLKTIKNTETIIKDSYLHLALLYSDNNILKQKYYLAKFDSISKSIDNSISEDLLLKYETVQKEKEIELLKIKEIENELTIQKNKMNSYVLISALSIASLLLILLFYRYKSRQKFLKQNIELEKQKTIQSDFIILQKENEISLKIDALKNNNLVIEELKNKLENASKNDESIRSIVSSFDQSYVSDKQWDNIVHQYSSIDINFINDLENSYSSVSKNDVKLSILMKLNYSNSGMAEILNITIEGVKKAKQRLKKKYIKPS